MRNRVVIGANFGDEGKGLTTDWLCSKHKPKYVVRFNGGAQAGHTVVTPSKKRHVFGHIGSGAFLDIPTFLSRFFVVNPLMFWKEAEKFSITNNMSIREVGSKIIVDPRCPVTTPFEMLFNQFLERMRGANRHGSCGAGFGETINRQEHLWSPSDRLNFSITFKDIFNKNLLKQKTENILYHYIPYRCKSFCENYGQQQFLSFMTLKTNINNFLQDFYDKCEFMKIHCKMKDTIQLSSDESVVFEGAQGLLLDQNHEFFPHVTRSNTGLKNVIQLCKENGYDSVDNELEVYYASRGYITRHGAGPLPGENKWSWDGIDVIDHTNIPNEHQGTLRFAPLDVDLISSTVNEDFENGRKETKMFLIKNLIVTCLDQFVDEPILELKKLRDKIEPINYHRSYGPTRNNVI